MIAAWRIARMSTPLQDLEREIMSRSWRPRGKVSFCTLLSPPSCSKLTSSDFQKKDCALAPTSLSTFVCEGGLGRVFVQTFKDGSVSFYSYRPTAYFADANEDKVSMIDERIIFAFQQRNQSDHQFCPLFHTVLSKDAQRKELGSRNGAAHWLQWTARQHLYGLEKRRSSSSMVMLKRNMQRSDLLVSKKEKKKRKKNPNLTPPPSSFPPFYYSLFYSCTHGLVFF